MRALVCGAGGFIGYHLTKHLKDLGWHVHGADKKYPEFANTPCDAFSRVDLTNRQICYELLTFPYDVVFQLAADMGGVGYIHSTDEAAIMRENTIINSNMVHCIPTASHIGTYFFSSSVCVYPDTKGILRTMHESDALPANPGSSYGWEKLYTEIMLQYLAPYTSTQLKIGRFQNCFGPYGTWQGGKEKAPAAICRKVAMAPEGGVVPVWGDGKAIRNFIYVDDLVRGIIALAMSPQEHLANIGTREYISIADFTQMIIDISGKDVRIEYVEGPVGVQERDFGNLAIEAAGWKPHYTLRKGMEITYKWIEEQVANYDGTIS
jgi:nucleoside-diphosphate-sugar epimerase